MRILWFAGTSGGIVRLNVCLGESVTVGLTVWVCYFWVFL